MGSEKPDRGKKSGGLRLSQPDTQSHNGGKFPAKGGGGKRNGNGQAKAAQAAEICRQCNQEVAKYDLNYLTILQLVKKQSAGCTGTRICAVETGDGFKTRRRNVCFDGKDCHVAGRYSLVKQLLEDLDAYSISPDGVQSPATATPSSSQTIECHSALPARRGKIVRHNGHGHR